MVNSRKIYKRRRLKKYTKRGGVVVTDIMKDMERESGAKDRQQQLRSVTMEDVKGAVKARNAESMSDSVVSPNYGIYIFPNTIKTLYVCSDLEGANIFNFTGDIHAGKKEVKEEYETETIEMIEQQMLLDKTIFDEKRSIVVSEINTNFNTDSEPGIISDLKKADTALAYTGDLFDNRPHSIRLLKKMLEMKDRPATHDRLILIGGNRDYNKLRLGIELFLITKDDNSIFSDTNKTLQNILEEDNLKFRTDNVEDFTYINWKTPNQKSWIIDVYNNKITEHSAKGLFYSRVKSMLEETMGAKYLPYKTELITILEDELRIIVPNDEIQDNFISKFFCILCMIMCFDYSNDEMVKTHPIYKTLQEYSGLIYKYLGYIDPMALFTLNGKKGLLSHSGFPDSGITSPLGYDPKITVNKINLEKILMQLYIDKQYLLRDYNEFMRNKQLEVKNIPPNIIRYIQITGAKPFENIKFTPIIGNNAFDIIRDRNNMYYGGADQDKMREMQDKWLTQDTSNLKRFEFFKDFTEGRKKLDYHIFGHIPQPFFPSVAQSNANTTHIALDICKTDLGGQGNNFYSFTMLKLTGNPDNDILFGRSRLAQISKPMTDNPGVYEPNEELQDKVIYYYEPITKFIKESNTITLSGVSRLHVEAQTQPPFKRMVYYEPKTAKPETAKPEEATPTASGGSKKKCMHICGHLCRKCHKHDHHCRIKCHECQQEHCHTRRKKRSKTQKRVKRPKRHRKSKKR